MTLCPHREAVSTVRKTERNNAGVEDEGRDGVMGKEWEQQKTYCVREKNREMDGWRGG